MAMSRKDFIEFARVIKSNIERCKPNSPEYIAVERLAEDIMGVLRCSNSAFDSGRFREAAGLKRS